jgi:hypothetical protein
MAVIDPGQISALRRSKLARRQGKTLEQVPNGTGMKIGDRVEVIAVPARVFPVAGIDTVLQELHVGEIVGERSYMHSIWIEASCVLPRPDVEK